MLVGHEVVPEGRLIEVIQVKTTLGRGTDDDPYVTAYLYFDKGGEFLAIRRHSSE